MIIPVFAHSSLMVALRKKAIIFAKNVAKQKQLKGGDTLAAKGNSKTTTKLNKSGLKEIKYDEKTVARLRELNASDEDIRRMEYPFYCSCCGRRYKHQRGNFYYSASVIYNGNNHYMTICKNCIDNLLDQYASMLGNQEEAMKRVCLHSDVYFSREIYDKAVKGNTDYSQMGAYVRYLNLTQDMGKTFDTYLAEQYNDVVGSYDEVPDATDGSRITKAMFERWQGSTVEDIMFLEEHYKMLKKQNPNADNNQEIFIKDLCTIKLLQAKAMRNNDITAFEKCTKMYRETFKQAGLKTVEEEDGSATNPLGVNAGIISQYTPEEFYKDKKLYDDFDGLGEYFAMHVERPLENLMFNGNKIYDIGDSNETE